MLKPLDTETTLAWQQGLCLQHKKVHTQTAQEAAYDTFFQFIKDQAILYKPGCNYRIVGMMGKKEEDLATVQGDFAQNRLRSPLYAIVLSMFCGANLFAMELVDRLPRKTFGMANNRRYEKVSCFPCGKKKKPVILTREELDLITSKKLLEAVKQGNRKEVYFNCRYGNAVNVKDEHGFAPLHYAARSLFVQVAQELLSVSHIDLESTTPQGFTALQMLDRGRASLEVEDHIHRCDAIIGLIHKCYEIKEKKRQRKLLYVLTEDIGDQDPVEDHEGGLWILKNRDFHKCGYVRNEKNKGEDTGLEEVVM